jgi:FixJ family two-component response regulator
VNGDGAQIIVVDDDASVRRGLVRLLRSAGYRVETFVSVHALLAGANLGTASCLVLDVRMPGPSRLDLQAALAIEGRPIPIVFITGHGDISMAVRAMKAGAVDFLSKPFDAEDLLSAIRQATSAARQAAPLGDDPG